MTGGHENAPVLFQVLSICYHLLENHLFTATQTTSGRNSNRSLIPMSAARRFRVRIDSLIVSRENGLGTQNEFLNHAPLIGLRLISELNAIASLRPKREEPY